MSKLYALTVGKNESRRYLESMLTQVRPLVDAHFYYDDQSNDGSDVMAAAHGAHVSVRPDGVPSFLEHEGLFRQDAWNMMTSVLPLKMGDWVLAIDTDEVLTTVGPNCCTRCEVDKSIEHANRQNADSVILPVPEVFGLDTDGVPLVRIDGLWGTIRGFRLFRYKPGGVYKNKAMGCGAEPTYVENGPKSSRCFGLRLMHFGYADPRDQVSKFRRYVDLPSHGHNHTHIHSIITKPTTQRWEGSIVKLDRAG